MIAVSDRSTLQEVRIREPFGYFVAAVPPNARRVVARASDSSGRILDRFSYDRLARSMFPTVFIVTPEP